MPDGRYRHKDGYMRVERGGKLVLEHRMLMEEKLERALARDEVVHHKNGRRADNRLENLEVLRIADHGRLHARRVAPAMVICEECGTRFPRRPSKVRYAKARGTLLFCSRSCLGRWTMRTFRISCYPRPSRRKARGTESIA